MSGRPLILFPLFSDLTTLPGIGQRTVKRLKQLEIEHPRDCLFHLPSSVIDRRIRDSVQNFPLQKTLTVNVTVMNHRPSTTKGGVYRVDVKDKKREFQLTFFHGNEAFLKRKLPVGTRRIVSGKLTLFDRMPTIVHPEYIEEESKVHMIPEFEPIYPLAKGLSQKVIRKIQQHLMADLPHLAEWIDPSIVERERWPDWNFAIKAAHTPKHIDETDWNVPSRARLVYDEFFANQLTITLARIRAFRKKGRQTIGNKNLQDRVLKNLEFNLTAAQARAISEITKDMAQAKRMNRLLQGDVGSGKTIVAFMALLTAVEAGGQGALMAPTEILARQHYETLRPLATAAGVSIAVLTGRDTGTRRRHTLSKLAAGEIDIMVGTHAVFQETVVFHDLRLAIVDEQHRFGVGQRFKLGKKGKLCDVLVMTATPIPRSLALTQFGELDASLLDQKPPGRKRIKTAAVSLRRITEILTQLRYRISKGQQCYWVCPLVEDSSVADITSVMKRFHELEIEFGTGVVDFIHGKMTSSEKESVMSRFKRGRTKILVATTVIEVGMNVPNATIMIIERAEKFGLAQLHQLRGRVGRGHTEAFCLLVYQSPLSTTARKRLNILRETEDGFQIAETDLELRGPGDLIGTAQAGLPKFRVADSRTHVNLLELAQKDARNLLDQDPDLTSKRGKAARTLLYLLSQDDAIRLLSVG